MWGWFGGQAAQSNKDAPKRAILQLRTQLDMLQKREKHLQTQIEQQQTIAKQNVSKNKEAARRALQRKKGHEAQLDKTSNQIAVLEDQIYAIEAANINKETMDAMRNAGDAMKAIHGKMTIEKVDDIMEGLHEQTALAEEINNAIVTGPTSGPPIDETELEGELDALEQETLDERMVNTGTSQVPHLPSGPTKEPATKQAPVEEDEEEELRKLQAEMAI